MESIDITTPDLMLRELVESDWAAVHVHASDPEATRYMFWGPNTQAETTAFLRTAIQANQERPRQAFELAVTLRETAELIGTARIHVQNEAHREGDIGYILRRSHWRRGFGTQIARGLVDFGFDQLGLHRIFSTCHVENEGSAGVMRRAGMKYEGTLRSHRQYRGVWADSLLFAILETDERAVSSSSGTINS